MLIIGSTALYHWFPKEARIPRDLDLLTPAKISANIPGVVDAQWHDAAELVIQKSYDKVFASPDMLLTLKVSHANWDIKWRKTIYDIQFLRDHGALCDLEVWAALTEVWKKVHGPTKVNMAKSMDTFFDDVVPRIHDHEMLHELVAFNTRPMHESLRENHSTAWCCEDLFWGLDVEAAYEVCLEEIMVTAIERSNLSQNSTTLDIVKAMSQAHFKLCTSMTTGWFARTLILNRKQLLIDRREKWEMKIRTTLKNLPH